MNSKKIISFLLAGSFLAFYSIVPTGCGNTARSENNDSADSEKVDTAGQRQNVKMVFTSVPPPVELGQLIQRSGATYDKDLMNDPTNVGKYTTAAKQGLNFGVYGADLSLTSMFDQTQDEMFFMQCTAKLSKALGVATAFNDETMKRLDANKGNHDSLMSIITDSYEETDDYLKENQRGSISALMITGGWVEALYVGTRMAEKTKNDELKTRLAEQKQSLQSLYKLLEMYKGEDGVDPVLTKLGELKTVYDGINLSSGGQVKSDDKENKLP